MAGDKGLKYAEQQLGVHEVYAQAQKLSADLEDHRKALAIMRRGKHSAEESYRDAELDYLTDERANHADLSNTAWEKLAKDLTHREPTLRKMRGQLADDSMELEEREAAIRRLQADLDIATARMTELGGYFVYLAELKRASLIIPAGPAAATMVWPGVSAT